MRTRSTLAALGAVAVLSLLAGGGVAFAAPAQTGPSTQACTDAHKVAVDLKAQLDAAVSAELAEETKAVADAKDALAAALPPVRDLNPQVYPGGVPALSVITPAYLNSILAKATTDGANSQLGGGGRDVIGNALAKFDTLDKAEAALKAPGSVVAGLQARLKLAEKDEKRACAAPPTTTPQPPTTTPKPPTTTPAPPTTSRPANDIDCVDVSRAEAQRILNADKSDPNNLDSNNNGTACEEGGSVSSGNSSNDSGTFPSRAPETGGE